MKEEVVSHRVWRCAQFTQSKISRVRQWTWVREKALRQAFTRSITFTCADMSSRPCVVFKQRPPSALRHVYAHNTRLSRAIMAPSFFFFSPFSPFFYPPLKDLLLLVLCFRAEMDDGQGYGGFHKTHNKDVGIWGENILRHFWYEALHCDIDNNNNKKS